MIQLKGSGLPAWSQVSDRRLAHIQRVTSLLRAWGAAMRVSADEANTWIDAGTWHDALRDAPVASYARSRATARRRMACCTVPRWR